jgi:hypothetical protein
MLSERVGFSALPFGWTDTPFGHAGLSCVTFWKVRLSFGARWIFLRSLLDGPALLLGTLDFPTLPFRWSTSPLGHAGLSCVTFWMVWLSFWARWIFLRYLLDGPPLLLGTLDFPALPFRWSGSPFGHAGFSCATFWMVHHSFWARWIFLRYLLDGPTLLLGTLDFPALLFR